MRERGSATVMAVAVISVVLAVSVGVVAVGRLMAAHVQTTSAADAAALAAAPLTFLPGEPKAEAAAFAAANGAVLVRCDCGKDSSIRVRVARVEVAQVVQLPIFGDVRVRARAAAEFDPLRLLG